MKYFLLCFTMAAGLYAQNVPWDAHRAFGYLEKQVQFGPRIPGSREHLACRDWIVAHAEAFADTVIVQQFRAYRPVTGDTVDAFNIIARFHAGGAKRVMLSTHWDTRPFADRDPLSPGRPVPGANDGASGTAVLMEMMEHIPMLPGDTGIDVVFWDAEDMGIAGSGEGFCQGSEYYARHPVEPLPEKGILIDMIGDHELRIPVEANSMRYAPQLVAEVWEIARRLGYREVFPLETGPEVYDDHVPLNETAGIPTINVIDFHYTARGRNLWHTTRDLPSYCSPRSLQIIGEVLVTWITEQ